MTVAVAVLDIQQRFAILRNAEAVSFWVTTAQRGGVEEQMHSLGNTGSCCCCRCHYLGPPIVNRSFVETLQAHSGVEGVGDVLVEWRSCSVSGGGDDGFVLEETSVMPVDTWMEGRSRWVVAGVADDRLCVFGNARSVGCVDHVAVRPVDGRKPRNEAVAGWKRSVAFERRVAVS